MSADRFDAFTALSLIAFAYAGGITLISGAVFAGLISAQALIPYALQKWFGLDGNWFLLVGGVLLIFTLLQNPEGVAGDLYRRLHKRPQVHAPQVDAATRERITCRARRAPTCRAIRPSSRSKACPSGSAACTRCPTCR